MSKISPYLAYAGALPFVLGALLTVLGVTAVPVFGPVIPVLHTYGLVIASFMAGVHWGQHLHIRDAWTGRLPILSNGITLVVWFGYLGLAPTMFTILLIIAFAALLSIDLRLQRADHLAPGYFETRLGVSGVVIVSLIMVALA